MPIRPKKHYNQIQEENIPTEKEGETTTLEDLNEFSGGDINAIFVWRKDGKSLFLCFQGTSLLAELEQKMDTQMEKSNQDKTEDSGCFEYFLVTHTAVKIGMTLKYPHHTDKVYSIKGKEGLV